jgi:hypothetical protein
VGDPHDVHPARVGGGLTAALTAGFTSPRAGPTTLLTGLTEVAPRSHRAVRSWR